MTYINGITLIVTGFPRSGTSVMMRMLEFGGIGIIASDKLKEPQHKHDPYGCLELDDLGREIKAHDIEWTKNKAIKIVTPYMERLPIDRPLKAIFMLRDVNEIITSLLAMKTVWDVDISESVTWARGYLKHNNVPILYVRYRDLMDYPKATAERIRYFLEVDLDVDAMAKAVDVQARTRYKRTEMVGSNMPDKLIRLDSESYSEPIVETYA